MSIRPFCDWLSLYQVHTGKHVPVVNDGRVFSVDQNGEIDWEVGRKVTHRGSHDTTLRIASDGNRVALDGNIGRFNRPDNVFGYSVADCIVLANRVLAEFGLPAFYDAKPMRLARPGPNSDDADFVATGAVLTRVDLTQNYATGSENNCNMFIRKLQSYKSGHFDPESYGLSGVCWGKGSKFRYDKVYGKAADYIRHYGESHSNHNAALYEYLKANGIARHESTLKSRWLKQKDLWRFSKWDDAMMEKVYALFTDPIRQSASVDEFLEIPGRAGEIAVAWRDGADLRVRLSKNTFYKYRRELLGYGIDIAIPANVVRLKTRVEVIEVQPVAAPSWYQLPKVG